MKPKGAEQYGFGADSNGIMFITSPVKINHLVQKLIQGSVDTEYKYTLLEEES